MQNILFVKFVEHPDSGYLGIAKVVEHRAVGRNQTLAIHEKQLASPFLALSYCIDQLRGALVADVRKHLSCEFIFHASSFPLFSVDGIPSGQLMLQPAGTKKRKIWTARLQL
jgi:hypothetical protein